jgi:two-component system, NtrC family, sensor kinase
MFLEANEKLRKYEQRLDTFEQETWFGPETPQQRPEREAIAEIEGGAYERVAQQNTDEAWVLNKVYVEALDEALVDAHRAALKLPFFLQQRMHEIVSEVRVQYRTWIVLTWVSSVRVGNRRLLLGFVYRGIVQPLRSLIQGSRRVAVERDFDHRIHLDTQDEVAELAEAMNAMTDQFQRSATTWRNRSASATSRSGRAPKRWCAARKWPVWDCWPPGSRTKSTIL